METKQGDRLLTAQELADRLGVGRNQIYFLVAGGKIPALRVGGVWRFEESAVLDALRREETAS